MDFQNTAPVMGEFHFHLLVQMVNLDILPVVLLTIFPLPSYEQQCKDLKPHGSKGKKKHGDVGCASFSYSPESDYNICKAYAKYQVGKTDVSKWGSIDGQCFFDTDAVVCMCVDCDAQDILKQLKSTKATKKLVRAITACNSTTSTPESATDGASPADVEGSGETPSDQEKTGKSAAPVKKGKMSAAPSLAEAESPPADEPTSSGEDVTGAPATTTTLDYETTAEPEPPFSPETAQCCYLVIERFEYPYDNSIPIAEPRVGIDEERVRVSQTPSIIYGSRRQEQIYDYPRSTFQNRTNSPIVSLSATAFNHDDLSDASRP
ncbi:hypothetical protein Y032_0251g197 [Ancylostoma ceylanicum]|nr:hypothetical protein Y032_0251g197 [Ancylostoma ceylanicum]